jgi:nucleoside-diphosphate-sugar epimerase
MKVLVTGATGFLGSHLVPELLAQGHRVGYVARAGSVLLPERDGCRVWTVGDNGEGIGEALAACRPDVVVHLAALYICEHDPDDIGPLIRTNVEFGAHLLDAMTASGCQALVYAGSAWQHYRDRNYCPVNLYAATKQAFSAIAEYYVDAAGLRLLELHLYDSYGAGDARPKLLNRLRDAAEAGADFSMSEGTQSMHLVHVDDLSRGLAMACEQVSTFNPGERRLYRLPSEKAVTLRELVDTLSAVDPLRPVKACWGLRPFRQREVFRPWEGAPILPGWQPRRTLTEGLCEMVKPTEEVR